MTGGKKVAHVGVVSFIAVLGIGLAFSLTQDAVAQGPPDNKPPQFDPGKINLVALPDTGGLARVDNGNNTAAKVRIHSTGSLDGKVLTVGANQASYDEPSGKVIQGEPGEVVTDVEAKRPQDDAWQSSGFTGTATLS